MGTMRQKISEQVLEDGHKVIQSTYVYQCRLIDGLEHEYELLEHDVRQLLDLLGVPDVSGVRNRLQLAIDTKELLK